MKVLQFPLVKITFCFIIGILIAHYTNPPFWIILSLLLGSFFISFISFLFLTKHKNYFNVFYLITAFILGSFTIVSHNETRIYNHFTNKKEVFNGKKNIEIRILEKLKSTNFTDRYIADITKIDNQESCGKIIFNIRKQQKTLALNTGTNLKINAIIRKNKKSSNPNQFNYEVYLENKNIYGQVYCDVNELKISSVVSKSCVYYASKLRNKIITNLEKNNFSKNELSVVNALILGQQQDISKELIHDYQYAGAIHILSVSGLHVGFILLFITFLLKPIPNTKTGSIIKLIIVIVCLWLFAILAGLAPCVIRSVTMFSFVAIGLYLRRSVNIYHTLLVSVLLILLFEPSFLFDVGFQLSYVALFFIIWLQPLLLSVWNPKNKIVSYFWTIITVSFAAQIGTFPLSIYYFHQFAGLFFITNLIILPGLSIILAIGVLVMILASFDIVFVPMTKTLEYSIFILNKIISWIASFQNFIIKDISFTNYVMIACYLLIISLIIWMKKPNFTKLLISLCAIILLQIVLIEAHNNSVKKDEFIVFNKSKSTLITQRVGNKVTVFSTDSILKSLDKNQVLKSYLIANYCTIKTKKSIKNLMYFNSKKIAIIDSTAVYLSNKKPDVLLIIHSPKISLDRVFKSWKPQVVIVDGSNFKSYVKIWKTTCRKEKIPFHATGEKGFYKL